MGLYKTVKDTLANIFNMGKSQQSVYLEDGVGLICEDKDNSIRKSTKIVAQHSNYTADIPIEFPRFCVNKTTARIGAIGMHSKNVLFLDADDEPTEGSKNLLTSGVIYDVIQDL